MNRKLDLLVAPCSYEAAKYAVEHWHYSKRMPAGKLVKYGVWESGDFIGCVLFGRGAIYRIGDPFGVDQDEACELVRIALKHHESPVSMIGVRAVKLLKLHSPGLRIIISYADASQGHLGAIYQAMNWHYIGETITPTNVIINGKPMHRRSAYAKYGTYAMDYLTAHVDKHAHYDEPVTKYKYVYPLDRAMRKQIEPLAKPYPKHAGD